MTSEDEERIKEIEKSLEPRFLASVSTDNIRFLIDLARTADAMLRDGYLEHGLDQKVIEKAVALDCANMVGTTNEVLAENIRRKYGLPLAPRKQPSATHVFDALRSLIDSDSSRWRDWLLWRGLDGHIEETVRPDEANRSIVGEIRYYERGLMDYSFSPSIHQENPRTIAIRYVISMRDIAMAIGRNVRGIVERRDWAIQEFSQSLLEEHRRRPFAGRTG